MVQNGLALDLNPTSKAIIGSQDVPYIYEDRLDKDQFMGAFTKIYYMSAEARREMGMKGKEHVEKNYNFNDFKERWVNLVDSIIEENGSWANRKNYNGIYFLEK